MYDFLIHLSFAAGILMLVAGLCMILAPHLVIRAGQQLNRWVSTDVFFKKLDTLKHTESWLYRYHLLFGALLVTASAYTFYIFMFAFDSSSGYLLQVFRSPHANEWLTASIVFICMLFSIVSFVIGAVILLRPSLLKRLEHWSNRWFMVDNSLQSLDIQHRTPDQAFIRRPRLTGIFVVAGGLYILSSLWSMM
jgi:hypothetical protein